jgi:ABC-type transporter Mla MlaB component
MAATFGMTLRTAVQTSFSPFHGNSRFSQDSTFKSEVASHIQGGDFMAANFRISIRRLRGKLCLKLTGDFDGSSAHELLNAIKKYSDKAAKICIDTSGLKQIYSFGQTTFHNNLFALNKNLLHIEVMGNNAALIAPKGCGVF